MSEREKNLLNLFAVAGVILLGFWGFSTYQSKKNSFLQNRSKAMENLDLARMALDSRAIIEDEITWLAEHEPEPRISENVGSDTQKIAAAEAVRSGMTVKNQKILPTIEMGTENAPQNYSIAQVEFQVSGNEEKLYSWFSTMHNPDLFRVISNINMFPNKEDDTLIDATVIFDQWFIPQTEENTPAETEATP